MDITKAQAINSLGEWSWKMVDDNLSQMTFYNGEDEVSKPADFPSDADIDARQVDMQTKADTGDYKSVQEINATY